MSRLRNLIKEVLSTPPKEKECDCGCGGCSDKGTTLNENINKRVIMTENMQYHVQNQLPLTENTFRYGSKAFLDLWSEARYLYVRDAINVNELDQEILTETHLGEYGIFKGEKVPLDLPILSEDFEDEDDFEDDDNIYTGPYSYGIDRRTWDDEWSKDKNIYNRLEAIRKMLKKYPKELAKLESDPYYPALDMTYDELVKWYKSISNFDLSEGMSKSAIKDAIKVIDKQIDTETGGDGEPLTDETLQALEQERERLENMLGSLNEDENNLDIYYRPGFKDFTGLVTKIAKEKNIEEKRKLMHVYVNILPKATKEKKYKLKQSINKMNSDQIDVFAYNLLMRDSKMTSLEEAEFKGKKVELNKPKRGGSKKFYVYVKDGDKVKKVSFGDTTGLKAKINDPVARRAFAKRHDCPNKNDKTKASYWSCRLPRYAKLLGLKSSFSGFW